MTVEIIGRACVAPGADSPQALFRLLRQGKCAVTSIPADRWDLARFWHPAQGTPGKTYTFAAGVLESIYNFDPAAFGMSQREALHMDPQQRVLLQLAWRALEDANISIPSLHGENVGVYIGASSLDHANLTVQDPAAAGPYFMTGNTLSIVSNRISHIFGLSGPSMTIDTACSSSLVALDQAMRALNAGEIETAIVGGINILAHPLSFVGFAQARMLSPEGLCRAYDDNGAGYVRAEGGVVFVLRRSDRARLEKDRSYAKIVATGVNSAGRTNGISLPSREAQANLLRSIYQGNNIDANQVAFVEGHGTGTKVGDPAEVWSIGTIIGANRRAPVPIGSIKSNIGHTEPASGLFGMLKAVMALENNYLPASLHFDTPNENIDFDGLNVRVTANPIELLRGKRPRLAGINSFGFGGANAHVVISDPDPIQEERQRNNSTGHVFLASAHTASSLNELLKSYKATFGKASRDEARSVIAASGANRTLMRHRFAARSDNPEDIVRAIARYLENPASDIGEAGEAITKDAKVAFVFSGNGSQWAGMGVEAFRENLHFRQCFTSVSALFKFHADISLIDLLNDPELDRKLADTKVAQPLLFAVQAALSDSLVAMGIKPTAVFGHSVGEIAAAYAAGALSLVDAVSIVAKRSLHQDLLAGQGTMAAVMLGEEAASAFAKTHGFANVCVAAINAHNSVTISGPANEVSAYRDAARKSKIPAQVLDINYPFHHPIIDQAKKAFLADIPDIAPRRSELAYISTVTGDKLDGTQLDPEYWWKNVREPVRFQAATEAAIAMGCTLFIEISPRPILSSYLKETVKQASTPGTVVSTLSRDAGEKGQDPVSRAMARAIAHGAAFESGRLFGQRNAHIRLPDLPFELAELRPTSTTDMIDLFGSGRHYTLNGWRADPNSGSWKNHIDAQLFPDLAEHVVDGKAILPGSGFIEIAVSAAQQFYGIEDVEITNLEIVRPLELSDARIMELSTIISPETGDIEIRSRERLTEDDWAIHAVARSRKPVQRSEVAANTLLSGLRATSTVLPARAYETARQFGLDYGPHFQLLSKAVTYGDRFIDVELKEPAASIGHPFVDYSLNPISIDATFHGLVALFDRLSGDIGGAPYIPVRFGSVRVVNSGDVITRAIVEIERVSANSIKAKFRFYGKNGLLIAAFDDCRFRRTYLRQRKTLDTLSFHYEAVASEVMLQPKITTLQFPLIAATDDDGIDNTTLLLNAAIYRACHEIALKLSNEKGQIDTRNLPGDFSFRCFLANCLYILEDVGLSAQKAGNWVIEPEFSLPPVADILKEVYGENSERVVEAVLINDTFAEALERVEHLQAAEKSGTELEDSGRPTFISEATLDHQAVHSPITRTRADIVLQTVEKALLSADGQSLRIVEAGTTSPAFSRRLANLAARHQASIIIVEPRDNSQRNLEIAFENDAHVRVLKKDEFGKIPEFDLLVSASGSIFSLIDEDAALRGSIRAGLRVGGGIAAASNAPTIFSDFAFGLTDSWFARSQAVEFPVGRLATVSQWQKCLDELGLHNVVIEERETAYGNIITIEAESGATDIPAPENAASAPVLVLHHTSFTPISASAGEDIIPVALTGDLEADKATCEKAFATLSGKPIRAIYLAAEPTSNALSDSEILQSGVLQLSAFAEAVRAHQASTSASDTHPRLALVLPGGAPVTGIGAEAAGVASGLWTFARVLQNEYDNIDIHCVDTADDISEQLATAQAVLEQTSVNREWLVNRKDHQLDEVRAVAGPASKPLSRTSAFKAATIRQQVSSQVGSIVWEETSVPTAGPGEIVVKVAATGLNFRDVMWAMGLLPEEALEDGFAGATIGMELSGHVVSVGQGVTDLFAGDAVMAIAPAAFSTHAVVSRSGVARLPANVSPVAAATVPVAFLTAYYALMELGRMRAGETVLIHGAAGGVGLAALQIAKLAGATVIATAGTREKRRFVKMLGADHVFDSRTLSFVDDIRSVTNGEGVDLVLNSLFAEAMEQSLGLVKPFGRFLELGKRDYYGDSKIGLRPFRRNISYFGIDADQLLVNAPELTKRIFTEIGALFEDGKLVPLPYRAFDFDEIGNAFRLMQNAGHIGKIVVVPPVAGQDEIKRAGDERMTIDNDGVHLVVGGIGGFGLAAANWLVEKGARNIALSTRRGIADDETTTIIERWAKKGVSATVHACDITDEAATSDLLKQLRAIGPLKSIIHAAMVLDDALISNLDRARNKPVIDVKAKGAAVLDHLTRGDDLDRFILFSSATTMVGNPGQGNYVAANGYLEGLARSRRSAGLPALAIGFGAIADVGYLTQNADVNDLLSKRIGKTALKAQVALSLVEAYIRSDPGTVDAAVAMISELDWAAARNLPVVRNALFEVVLRSVDQNTQGGDGRSLDLVAMIEGKSPQEAEDILFDLVANEIAAILRVSKDTISRAKVLKEIGLDSLMAVELGISFQQNTGFDMPLSGVADSTTVGDVARKLYEKVSKRDQNDSADADQDENKIVQDLAQRHTSADAEKAASQ